MINDLGNRWADDRLHANQTELLNELKTDANVVSFFNSHPVGQHALKKCAQLRGNAAERLAAEAMTLTTEQRHELAVQFQAANMLFRIIHESHTAVEQSQAKQHIEDTEQ